ncbi:MAG: hypothetical protein AAF721_05095 [Myxococcota bacterium]
MRRALLTALWLVACAPVSQADNAPGTDTDGTSSSGSTTRPEVETKPWDVETETSPPSMSTGGEGGAGSTTGAPMGTSGDPDEGTEDGEEEGVEEDFVGMFGFGPAVPGESYTPEGEAIAFLNGVDECVMLWSGSAVPDDTCMECEFAFRITIESTEAEEDIDCVGYGFDAATLEGSELAVGVAAGRALYIDEGEGWTPVEEGFGELDELRGVFEWEFAIEP